MALRSYVRQRERLLEYAASHIQHMQKALTEINLQLHHVVADVTGATRQSARSCDHRFWDDCTTIIFGFGLQKAQLFERALRRGGIAEADEKGQPM